MERRPEISCCIGCGRDTTAKSGICAVCLGNAKPMSEDDLDEDDDEYIRRRTDE